MAYHLLPFDKPFADHLIDSRVHSKRYPERIHVIFIYRDQPERSRMPDDDKWQVIVDGIGVLIELQ